MEGFKETYVMAGASSNPCTVTNQLTSYSGVYGVPGTTVINTGGTDRIVMSYSKGNGDFWAGEL